MRVRTQFGGWRLWLGAGEGLAKAREELTRAKPSRTIHLKTALRELSSSNSSRVSNLKVLHQLSFWPNINDWGRGWAESVHRGLIRPQIFLNQI